MPLNLNVWNLKIIKIVLFIMKWLKSFCRYSPHEVLHGGCIYNLYVDAAVVLGPACTESERVSSRARRVFVTRHTA